MPFKYLFHLNLHSRSQEVIAFNNFFKKHFVHLKQRNWNHLKYKLDVGAKNNCSKDMIYKLFFR